jgi:GWxTD domain-containing protein
MTSLRAVPLALAVCMAAHPAFAQPIDQGTPSSYGEIRFQADMSAIPHPDGTATIEVSYQVPYDELVFLRESDAYVARYDLTAIAYDADGRQIAGDSWREIVRVDRYADTNSRLKSHGGVLSLGVGPGRHSLKLVLSSVDTRASGTIERQVDVPDVTEHGVTVGTPIFEARAVNTASRTESYVPNPLRDYGEERPVVRVRVPVYGDTTAVYDVRTDVLNDRGELIESTTDTLAPSAFRTDLVTEFGVLDYEVGTYVLRVTAEGRERGGAGAARASFRVVTSPRSWGGDFQTMIEQLGYIASRDEIERILDAPEDERDAAWEAFWTSRDPTPDDGVNEFKREFVRRLGYANLHFRSTVQGWRTDMGRIYIQYGEPDDVESQPVGRMLNAWEIWYYYREHTKFIFVDRDGFGEFALVERSGI